MNDYQLALPAVMRRVEALYPRREVVFRDAGGHRAVRDYATLMGRARRLAVALTELGLRPGERVATLCWNTQPHFEAYFGVTAAGGVVHTVNPRLHRDELAYIVARAEDRIAIVDESLLGVLETFRADTALEHVIVAPLHGRAAEGIDYEELLAAADEARFRELDVREDDPAILCFTSGTTGKPKGVVYTHRGLVLKSIVEAHADLFDIRRADTVQVVVPLFHIAAWCLPFAAALVGAEQVLAGSAFDDRSVLDAIEQEGVTVSAGVPTIWLGVRQRVEAEGRDAALATLRKVVSGGSAVPPWLIDWYRGRGVELTHAWGMTESIALGSSEPRADTPDERPHGNAGYPIPFVELRARGEQGLVPWDGETVGELEMRGAYVIDAYFGDEDPERFTDDGWLRTGDIVAIEPGGSIEIRDRAKDLIKSGGEWIASIALEHALMDHPRVREAAVIAKPDERWQERPLALVVAGADGPPEPAELLAFIAPHFPKWWLPDDVRFIDELPHTGTGKVDKAALRRRYLEPA